MHAGTIIVKNQGKEIPEEYLKVLIERRSSCASFAVVAAPGKIDMSTINEKAELNDLQEFQGAFKENKALLYFGQNDGGYSDNSIPPFVLVKDKSGAPALVAFIEGNFPSFARETSSHSDAYYVALEWLEPKFQKQFDRCDGDIEKLLKQLDEDEQEFNREWSNTCTGRGVLALLASNGKLLTYTYFNESADDETGKDTSKKFESGWGWTSNTLGYVEAGKADAPVKKGLMGSKLSIPNKPEGYKEFKEGEEPKDSASKAAITAATKPRLVRAPSNLDSKNAIKNWYRNWCVTVPEDWKNRPEVALKSDKAAEYDRVYNSKTGKDLKDIDKLIEKAEKPEAPAVLPPTDDDEGEAPKENRDGQLLGIIPPKVKEAVSQVFLKDLDKNSKIIVSPEDWKKTESKVPGFFDVFGSEMRDKVLGMSPDFRLKLCMEYPEAAAALIRDLVVLSHMLLSERNKREKESKAA